MARFRLSGPAQADLRGLLARSLERWGIDGRTRYAELLAAAMRTVAVDPQGPTTRDRADALPGIRSFHIKHTRGDHGVKMPVHVIYYRTRRSGSIEIIRVLHERMEPSRHRIAKAAPRAREPRPRRDRDR